nr:MAG TPA: hypothetical protein [Caudoviricetes sp.]
MRITKGCNSDLLLNIFLLLLSGGRSISGSFPTSL